MSRLALSTPRVPRLQRMGSQVEEVNRGAGGAVSSTTSPDTPPAIPPWVPGQTSAPAASWHAGLQGRWRPGTPVSGRPVSRWAEMREACACHATRTSEKLRSSGLVASRIAVFLHTDPHGSGPWYSAQCAGRIEPTADAQALIGEAVRMLAPLWRDGHS